MTMFLPIHHLTPLGLSLITICLLSSPGISAKRQQIRPQDAAINYISEEELKLDMAKPKNIKSHEIFLFQQYELQNNTKVSELNRWSLQAKLFYGVYNDLMMQRYDSLSELRESGGPEANQELCLQQLSQLNERLDLQMSEKYNSKDINLAQLLNTFGRSTPSLYIGDGFWPGNYGECQRLKVETPEGQVPSRYCVAHVTHKSSTENKTPLELMTAMKSGVCLPKSCDSLDYKNKYKLILRLMESNMREIDRNQGDLTELYCLPDSQSPLRTWWWEPKTMVVVLCLLAWLSLQVYATFKKDATGIYKSLSIAHNLAILCRTGKSLSETAEQTDGAKQADTGLLAGEVERPVVELKVIEAIKVLAQMYIICGHVLMALPHIIENNREDGWNYSPLYMLSNMMPAYSVNAFFGITGLLTSYLMFKQKHLLESITKPNKWIFIVLHRYLRIMPMYIVVVIYAKYLAKYLGSGPFWDYGTSALAHRRNCEEESWIWTLLFTSNFKPMLRHCIPSAWYLSNDFQFFLITPILLTLLNKHKKLGKRLLQLMIAASTLTSFLDVYWAELEDVRPIALYMPHGFKIYTTYLPFNYTAPQNRICAYISGLLMGLALYKYEKRVLEYRADKIKGEKVGREPGWSNFMTKHGLKLSGGLLLLTFVIVPILANILPLSEPTARVLMALTLARAHVNVALAICIYIMLSSTGYGVPALDRFLSSGIWKPLSRLSLCVVLVNVEVIIYITQIKTHIMYLDNVAHLSLIIVCIPACYAAASVMFVLFEAPIKAVLTHLFKRSIKRGSKDKRKE